MRNQSAFTVRLALSIFAPLALACGSSSDPPAPASSADAGGDSAVPIADAGPPLPDVPEPAWSGTTVEPGCTTSGCIRELTKKAGYPASFLAGYADPSFTIDNGMVQYFVRYWSDGREITGTLYVPDSAAPAEGFPVAVVNQFTTGVSALCAPSAGQLGIGVSSATALHGFLTLVPDATSYDAPPYGAYLVAKVAGRAALDGARAAFHTTQALGITVARKAVIAGLSQGGHSTMAAAAQMPGYAPHLEIRGFAAVAPPANLRGIYNRVIQGDLDVGIYVVMRLYSWNHFYGLNGDPMFKEPYASQVAGWMQNDCIYVGSSGNAGTLYGDIPAGTKPSAVLSDAFVGYGKNDSWPDGWKAAYADSESVPVGLKPPLVIFQGADDTTVLPADTDAYVTELQAAGVTVEYRKVAGGTHGTTALSSFTVAQVANDDAVAWMRARMQ